ncbi:LysM peptidoglycan-binding domain-containing protein [Frankia sp. Mgl5]|uniref:LysM peptidoglycan-binding domain-containing protein n=1 Tax=Frankia sp. Mgl5 TaxID=2933793 RepID=UPI00200ECACF|nr:LysM domain-containing protein [Frankia sp. Mgl5]MCK9932070.1 LysM peptidoglycan-binding domain-containing protein [Frankia sp. Mgl5]
MISGARRDAAARVGSAVLALGVAAVLILLGPRLADLPSSPGDIPTWFADEPELAFANCLGIIAWICLLWLCAGVVLGVLAALPGAAGRVFAALARRVLPGAVRRIVEIGLGVTLVAASVSPVLGASPASAATGPPAATASASMSADASAGAPAIGPTGGLAASQRGWPYLGHPDAASGTGRGLPDDVQVVPMTPVSAADPPTRAQQPPAPATAAPDPGTAPTDRSATATARGWPFLGHPDRAEHTDQSGQAGQPSGTSTPRPTNPTPGAPAPSAPAPSAPSTTAPAPAAAAPSASAPSGNGGGDPLVPSAPLGTGTPGTAPGASPGTPPTNPGAAAEVVVLRGDSLWTIVARHLGPTATTDQIAAEWPRWWSANADVIGPDPDLLLPGQRLLPPPSP